MTTPIPNCPQPETPLRERAWTDGQRLARVRELAELWKAGDFEERECAEKLLAILGDSPGAKLVIELDALREENEALRADAERLSWLLQNLRGADLYFLIDWIGDDMHAARAAIDAAMKGANPVVSRR